MKRKPGVLLVRFSILFTIHFSLFTVIATAQQKAIDTVAFNVVSKYKPVITDAVKLNDNPKIADTVKIQRKADYNNLVYNQFPTSYTPAPLDAIHMKGEPLDKLFHSYLSAGYGNYNTLYGEYYFNCLRSRNFDYGIHLNHLSSDATLKGEGYSGYAYNDVNLYGKAFLHNHTLYAQGDFDEHIVHDYGYDVNKEKDTTISNNSTRERYNYAGGSIDFKSTYNDSSHINHDINVGYYNFCDIYNATENNVDIKVHAFSYYDKQRIDVKASANYYTDVNPKEDSAKTWNFQFNPYFSALEKHWDAHLGIKLFYDTRNNFNAFPDFIGRFHVAHDAVMFYAGIDGDKTFSSYNSLEEMNPYMIDYASLQYTYTQIHIFGGITGTITNDITYNLSGYQSEIKNMPLFVTETLETLRNRFSVVYDKVLVRDAHLDVSYRVKEALKFTLGGDYFMYNPSQQVKVWYHPDFNVNFMGQYTLKSKYVFKAQVYVLGPQYAPTMLGGQIVAKQIAPYPDLNIGFDYHHNRFLTAFINLNNLANVSYQRWLNYPTQGFNVLAGVRLAF